jgi:hypothetical protein
VASPRSVTRRKRHVANNLDKFGPQCAYLPTSCLLCSSGLIGCDYKMMHMREGSLPRLILSGRQGYKSVQGKSTSSVHLGVLYMDLVMYSFLFEYSFTVILALHAIRCHVAQVG